MISRVPKPRLLLWLAAALLVSAPAVLLFVAAPEAAPDVASNFKVERLADGVYAVIRKDPPGMMCDGNCAFIVNDSDVVVVDAPEASREVLEAIRKVTNKPVRTVINTHWHDDHIIGNQVYRDSFPGVQFIAHRAMREYLPEKGLQARKQMIQLAPKGADDLRETLKNGSWPNGTPLTDEERESLRSDVLLVDHYMDVVPKAEIVLPTAVVDSSLTLRRGSRTLRILYLGRGHTSGDLVVFLPREGIVMSGDLVVWPVPLVGGDQSHVGDWSDTLARLRALNARVIVPGHGPVERDDSYLILLRSLFAAINQQTRAAVSEGKTLEESRGRIDLTRFRDQIAGRSSVRRRLFDMYVEGPAVTSAFGDAKVASRR